MKRILFSTTLAATKQFRSRSKPRPSPTVTTDLFRFVPFDARQSSPRPYSLFPFLGFFRVSFFCQEIGTPDLFHRIGNH
jgi:hypothetical protein